MPESDVHEDEITEIPRLWREFTALAICVLRDPRKFVQVYILEHKKPLRFALRMFLFSVAVCVLVAVPALLYAQGETRKGLHFISAMLDAGIFALIFSALSLIPNPNGTAIDRLLALYFCMTAVFNPLFELFYLPIYFLLPAAVTPSFCAEGEGIDQAIRNLSGAEVAFLFVYKSVGNWLLFGLIALWYGRALTVLLPRAKLRLLLTALASIIMSNWFLVHEAYPFVCAHEGFLNRLFESVWG